MPPTNLIGLYVVAQLMVWSRTVGFFLSILAVSFSSLAGFGSTPLGVSRSSGYHIVVQVHAIALKVRLDTDKKKGKKFEKKRP